MNLRPMSKQARGGAALFAVAMLFAGIVGWHVAEGDWAHLAWLAVVVVVVFLLIRWVSAWIDRGPDA